MSEIAGINTASLSGYLHSSKTRTRWTEGFHDELNGHVFDLERDGHSQVVIIIIINPLTARVVGAPLMI